MEGISLTKDQPQFTLNLESFENYQLRIGPCTWPADCKLFFSYTENGEEIKNEIKHISPMTFAFKNGKNVTSLSFICAFNPETQWLENEECSIQFSYVYAFDGLPEDIVYIGKGEF